MERIFLGIDLGGTNIKAGCLDHNFNLLCKTAAPTDADLGPDAVIDRITDTAAKLLSENGLTMESVEAAGIGSPGTLNIAEGMVISAPNFPKFRNIPLRDMLSRRLSKPVVFENDANAACWAEYRAGAGKGVNDMLFMTLGTGIGGGIISNGELVHGYFDNAAEFGHIIIQKDGRGCVCGQQGCVEAYSSAAATAKRAGEALQAGAKSSLRKIFETNGDVTCKDVFEHCAQGDRLAVNIVEGTCSALGLLCVNLLHITGPQRIVFAGGMIAAGQILADKIRYFFEQYIWHLKPEPVEICLASLGEDAGIIGTAALALHAEQQGKL